MPTFNDLNLLVRKVPRNHLVEVYVSTAIAK